MTAPATPGINRFGEIIALAAPIIAGMGSQIVFNLVDTAMVGRLGTEALAAVGLAGMMIWASVSVLQGLGYAVQSATARRLGEHSEGRIHEAMVNTGWLVVLLGIPYAAGLIFFAPGLFGRLAGDNPNILEHGVNYMTIRLLGLVFIALNNRFRGYFNGRKMANIYMFTLLSIHPLNILLNYVFIFGKWGFPSMGVEGAALGTTIATGLGCLNFMRLMFKHRGEGLKLTSVSRKTMGALLGQAIPNCARTVTLAFGVLMFFAIAARIDGDGNALAATKVLVELALVCLHLSMGFGMAALTLVSSALGEGSREQARRWLRSVLVLGCSVLTVTGLILALFPRFWLGCFGLDSHVVDLAATPLVLLGLMQSYDAAAMILSYAHLGSGAAKRAMVISFANQWLIFLPACFMWVQWFEGQLLHLWICMAAFRFLLFLSFLISTRGNNWLRVAV